MTNLNRLINEYAPILVTSDGDNSLPVDVGSYSRFVGIYRLSPMLDNVETQQSPGTVDLDDSNTQAILEEPYLNSHGFGFISAHILDKNTQNDNTLIQSRISEIENHVGTNFSAYEAHYEDASLAIPEEFSVPNEIRAELKKYSQITYYYFFPHSNGLPFDTAPYSGEGYWTAFSILMDAETLTPVFAGFKNLGGTQIVPWNRLHFSDDDRPLAYIGLGTHSLFPRPGDYGVSVPLLRTIERPITEGDLEAPDPEEDPEGFKKWLEDWMEALDPSNVDINDPVSILNYLWKAAAFAAALTIVLGASAAVSIFLLKVTGLLFAAYAIAWAISALWDWLSGDDHSSGSSSGSNSSGNSSSNGSGDDTQGQEDSEVVLHIEIDAYASGDGVENVSGSESPWHTPTTDVDELSSILESTTVHIQEKVIEGGESVPTANLIATEPLQWWPTKFAWGDLDVMHTGLQRFSTGQPRSDLEFEFAYAAGIILTA